VGKSSLKGYLFIALVSTVAPVKKIDRIYILPFIATGRITPVPIALRALDITFYEPFVLMAAPGTLGFYGNNACPASHKFAIWRIFMGASIIYGGAAPTMAIGASVRPLIIP
jgi:hypothetical protein